jgi:hypothetical protein
MPPKSTSNKKRYMQKLVARSMSQRVSASHSTTTRHHITAFGQSTKEVPRLGMPKPTREVCMEPTLDAPQEENAVGVKGDDGMEDPASKVHDPEILTEEQTQVSSPFFGS